jgi:hypothetical protein
MVDVGDGVVISGWGAIARTQEQAAQLVQDRIDQDHAAGQDAR